MSGPGDPEPQLAPNRVQGPTVSVAALQSGEVANPEQAEHKRAMDRDAAIHEREEATKDAEFVREKERADRRQATYILFGILAVVALVALACLWIVVSNQYPSSTVEKAFGALLAIVGGFVGFLTGQAVKK